MSPRLLKDEKGSSPSSKGGGGFQESKIYESTRDGEGSGPSIDISFVMFITYSQNHDHIFTGRIVRSVSAAWSYS
jgi:hypothetical protein